MSTSSLRFLETTSSAEEESTEEEDTEEEDIPPPPDWPTPPLGRVMKAVKPGNKEVSDNPRARSAVLRVAEAR